jgi:hypothetical protein
MPQHTEDEPVADWSADEGDIWADSPCSWRLLRRTASITVRARLPVCGRAFSCPRDRTRVRTTDLTREIPTGSVGFADPIIDELQCRQAGPGFDFAWRRLFRRQ